MLIMFSYCFSQIYRGVWGRSESKNGCDVKSPMLNISPLIFPESCKFGFLVQDVRNGKGYRCEKSVEYDLWHPMPQGGPETHSLRFRN